MEKAMEPVVIAIASRYLAPSSQCNRYNTARRDYPAFQRVCLENAEPFLSFFQFFFPIFFIFLNFSELTAFTECFLTLELSAWNGGLLPGL
jgi:hypothetical protein